MKLSIQRDPFLEALQTVQSVVSSRTSLPILSNVLIRCEDGHVTLSTTDLDTGIRTQAEASIEKSGSITLPARKLFSIIKELPAVEISLEVDGKQNTVIRAGKSYFKIMGMPEDDFPPFPKTENASTYRINQKELRDMLKKTSYAMSSDESRYVLNGVLMSFKDAKLTIVATDGRRLALASCELDFPKSAELDVILPSKAVSELTRVLSDDEELQLAISENQISFSIGNTYLVSKLIEGNYPNYHQVIPSETKERLTVEREILLNCVRRVSLLSSDKSNSVKLNLRKNELEITANSPDVGEAKESLVAKYSGKEFSIAFNPDYLCDPLKNLATDEIFIDFTDELSPGVIRHLDPFLYVIMPMRTA
ncbi:MAG: DNA polymerase III subunit beta [Candidatus Methylacidiphilales bacterium]